MMVIWLDWIAVVVICLPFIINVLYCNTVIRNVNHELEIFVPQSYTAEPMARPKGEQPPREYINARIRKDYFDELTELTRNGNPSRSQAIELAVGMWLDSLRHRKPGRLKGKRSTTAR